MSIRNVFGPAFLFDIVHGKSLNFLFFAEKVMEFSRKVPWKTMDFDEPKCAGILTDHS